MKITQERYIIPGPGLGQLGAPLLLEDLGTDETDTTLVPHPDGTGGIEWGPGGGSSSTSAWLPLTTVVAGEPVLVWDGDDGLIPTSVPF